MPGPDRPRARDRLHRDATNFARIADLYALLSEVAPSPIVDLNRGIAAAFSEGPDAGVGLLDTLNLDAKLGEHHLLHATRADLLRRLGRPADAPPHYRRALELAPSETERPFLQRRLDSLLRCTRHEHTGIQPDSQLAAQFLTSDCHAGRMSQPKDLLPALVDADNVSPSRMVAVLTEVASFGTASVKRVYGDWTQPRLASWKLVGSEHVIQPIQQFANTVGKNATDRALIIDAMDLLYTRRFDAFCIVSSDSDLTRLASRIREESVAVCGFGERKNPQAFRNACDRFNYLDVLDEPSTDAAPAARPRVTPAKLRSDMKLVAGLRASVTTDSGDDGWAPLSAVGSLMRKQ